MKRYFSEFVGTYILVFCATSASVTNTLSGGSLGLVGIAITSGLVVLAMIYTLGEISGAHMNPAITIAFGIAKRMSPKDILPYILSQTSGALLASITIKYLFPLSTTLGATRPSGSESQSFFLEIILAFILMLVILQVSKGSKEKGITAGIAIASVVSFEVLFAGPISGGSMNPVRSLAPALITGNLHSIWIYLLAPPLGACLAVFASKLIQPDTGHG
jgi:aquaporin NIP